MTEPQWLQWSKALNALAQNGLTYAQNYFDRERYQTVRDIAAQMLAQPFNAPPEQIADLFSLDCGYLTPKVDVRGVILCEDKLLLVQERSDGLWTLPGGWADVNESPREVVIREVWEESGFQVNPMRLLAVYDRSKHEHIPYFPVHIYKLYILCELSGGQATESVETSAIGFFAEDELPPLSISRVTEAQLKRFFFFHRNPHLPTDFD